MVIAAADTQVGLGDRLLEKRLEQFDRAWRRPRRGSLFNPKPGFPKSRYPSSVS